MAKRTTKKTASNVGISLKEFRLVKFAIGTTEEPVSKRDDVEFNIQIEIAKNEAGNVLRVQYDITADLTDEAERGVEPILALSTQTYFNLISDEEDLAALQLPVHLVTTMVTVAYGATRGLIFAKTAGTPIEGLVLPITTASSLISGLELQDDGKHERGI